MAVETFRTWARSNLARATTARTVFMRHAVARTTQSPVPSAAAVSPASVASASVARVSHSLAASLKGLIVSVLDAILNIGTFLVIALGFGIWSSWAMIEHGSSLTTRSNGPWVLWTAAGKPEADPYTRAHFARVGSLPLSPTAIHAWEAHVDEDGQKLHSSCEYAVEGTELAVDWWSLAVFDEQGGLITNAANRYAFNSRTMARSPDGSYLVALARDARPGNWLPTGGAGRLVLVMSQLAPRPNATSAEVTAAARALPSVRRLGCR
jgi:hypothetical protein